MRTTVRLDDDILRAARAIARRTGRSLGSVVSELARVGLRSRVDLASSNGFPTFRVRADAEVIPAARVGSLLANDPL